MTLNYFRMFHDATREHAESLTTTPTIGPMQQAIKADEARHMRAPMYYAGDPSEVVRIECACGNEYFDTRSNLIAAGGVITDDDGKMWRIERCDGSSCGIKNCGRMLAKCGRCRS